MNSRFVRMALLNAILLRGESVLAQQYTVTDLGSLGGPITDARAINASGQVIGYTYTKTNRLRAFLWTEGTMQDLGSLPDNEGCTATAINDRGEVVGLCGGPRPFLWTAEVGMVELPIPGNAWASGVNSQGHVVGVFGDPSGGPGHAFLYRNGILEDLGVFGAFGINDQDQVVGVADHGARWWDSDGQGHDLEDVGTLDTSSAYAITPDGIIAGGSTRTGSRENPKHAVLWTPYGVSDLGTLEGDTGSFAYAINGDLVVGVSFNDSGKTRAFIYDTNGPGYAIDLNDLIPPDSEVLAAAHGINAAGQIVALGRYVNGRLHSFLLTPTKRTDQR